MRTSFAVLGDGAWGTAMAVHLARDPEHRVALWSARAASGELLRQRRESPLLPGVPIPAAVHLTADIAEAVDGADLWVVAIPTVYLRGVLERIAPAVAAPPAALSLTKGVEVSTFLRPSEILRQVLGARRIAVLSGPSHAEEVSRGLPTSVVVASTSYDLARWVQQCFTTDR